MTTIPEDPPPPYPGRSDDIIVPPQPFYDTIPNPRFPYPQLAASLLPLSRVEFERLRASVRTVVDVLNALLVGLDEEEGRGGGGVTGWGEGGARTSPSRRCGHAVWASVEGAMHRCEVCADFYGVDIWYHCGRDGDEDGVKACGGCGVRACGFCRENRV